MELLQAFFAGVFMINGIPHLVNGISGKAFMTPFKKPSSPLVNIIWAFVNFAIGYVILGQSFTLLTTGINFWVFLAGAFLMGLMDASSFANPNFRFPWQKG